MFRKAENLSQVPDQKQNIEQKPGVEANEAAAFTLVTADIHTTIRANSLYKLIETLNFENSNSVEAKGNTEAAALLSAYHIESRTDANEHRYMLIGSRTIPKNDLFSKLGFKRQGEEGWHLRVDEFFANDNTVKAQRGLSACHYTEWHKSLITSDSRVAHVFIGQDATIISCQVKEYEDDGDESGKQIEINELLNGLMRENVQPALELVEKLVREKNKRYQNAVDRSYEIEAELESVLQKILINDCEEKNRLELTEQYQTLVGLFLEEMEKINRYNDQEIDKRGERLVEFAQYMNPKRVIAESTESEEDNQSENAEVLLDTDTVQTNVVAESLLSQAAQKKENKRNHKLNQMRARLIEEVQKLADELKILTENNGLQNTQTLILLQTLKLKLRPKLVELAFFLGITEEDNTFLRAITIQMNQIPVLMDSFRGAVELGNVDVAIQLYPYVQDEDLRIIFYDLINTLIKSTDEKLPPLIEMAKYFYQHSHQYRETIATVDYLYFQDHISVQMSHVASSFLFKTFLFQNYLAFELFLEQGCNPNRAGFAVQGVTASLLNAIVYFMGTPTLSFNDFRYIKALLEADAILDLKTPDWTTDLNEMSGSVFEQKKMKELIRNSEKKQELRNQLGVFSPQASAISDKGLAALRTNKEIFKRYSSALEILCALNQSPNIELLKLLVPKSNLSALISGCVLLSDKSTINTRLIMGPESCYMITCGSKGEADKITNNLLAGAEQQRLSLLVYHTDPQEASSWLPSIKFLTKITCEKHNQILDECPEQATNLYGSLRQKAEPLKRSKVQTEITEYLHFCRSILYLLMLEQDGTFEQVQKMVQTLCFIGKGYYPDSTSFDKVGCKRAMIYFDVAIKYSQSSLYFEKLEDTLLPQFAKEHFSKLESRLKLIKTHNLLCSGVTEHLTENKQPSMLVQLSEAINRLTTAATMHAASTPSLSALVEAQKNPKKAKQGKKGAKR